MIIIRDWEEFDGGPSEQRRRRMYVTLNKRGMILINNGMFAAMGNPEAALLLYDRRNKTIGVRPAEAGAKKAFPVRQKSGSTHRSIYAWPFCRHFQIVPFETVRFTAPQIDNQGTLLLDLNGTVTVTRKVSGR